MTPAYGKIGPRDPHARTQRDAYAWHLSQIRRGNVGRVELGGMDGYTHHPQYALGILKGDSKIDPNGALLKRALVTGAKGPDPRISQVFTAADVDKVLNPEAKKAAKEE